MPIVKVASEILPTGAVPTYDFGFWPYPVFTMSKDGSILRLEPGRSYTAPLFGLEHEDPKELGRKVLDRLTAICLCAGFAGRFQVAVCGETVINHPSKPKAVIHSISLGVLFSMDWDPDTPGNGYTGMGWRINAGIDDLLREDDHQSLRDAAAVMEVQLS